MTTIYAAALSFVALLLLGWIVAQMRSDTATERTLAVLTAELPEERVSLLALEEVRNDWPQRQTPTDLQAAYEPRHASEIRATIRDHQPRHGIASAGPITQEFHAIMARHEWEVAA